jgi:hypothetical protein
MSDKKGELVSLFLSLSSTRFTMIHKKRTSPLSSKMGKYVLKHGNIDTLKVHTGS